MLSMFILLNLMMWRYILHPLHDNNKNSRLIARAMEAAHGKWDFLFSQASCFKLFCWLQDVYVKSARCPLLRRALKCFFVGKHTIHDCFYTTIIHFAIPTNCKYHRIQDQQVRVARSAQMQMQPELWLQLGRLIAMNPSKLQWEGFKK